MLELLPWTDRDALADVDKGRDKLELAHDVQVRHVLHFEYFDHVIQNGFNCFIVLDLREHSLLELYAPDLEPLLVDAL